jgi:DNA-binding Lrp family transcriptional regulator
MQSSGFLLGSSIYPNPSLLDLKGGAYAFDVPSSSKQKIQIIEQLKLMDCPIFIHNHNGSFVGIFFVYRDEEAELRNKLKEFRNLSGEVDGIFSPVIFPPCRERLSEPERVLISRLTEGREFQSYSQIAKELKVSVRTAKRRMAKIFRAQAILSSPTLNYQAIKEAVPADMIVSFATPHNRGEMEEKIIKILDDYLIFIGLGEEFIVYNLILPSMHAVIDLTNTVKRIEGVKSVRAELVNEHIDLTRNLGEIYRRQI